MKKLLVFSMILIAISSVMSIAIAANGNQRTLLNLTNADRHDKGIANLKWDADLARKATKHSKWMAENGLVHSKSLAPYLRGKKWSIAGENIGSGPDLAVMEQAFMDSKYHRRNILDNRFKKVGIGIYWDGTVFWVTVLFYG